MTVKERPRFFSSCVCYIPYVVFKGDRIMVNNRRQLPAEGEDVWETRRQKWPDSLSDLEIGGCEKSEGSRSTPLEWFAALWVTWGYWHLGEAKGSPKSCSLTLLQSSLLLSGIHSLFKVINNQNPELNMFFKNSMALVKGGAVTNTGLLSSAWITSSLLSQRRRPIISLLAKSISLQLSATESHNSVFTNSPNPA